MMRFWVRIHDLELLRQLPAKIVVNCKSRNLKFCEIRSSNLMEIISFFGSPNKSHQHINIATSATISTTSLSNEIKCICSFGVFVGEGGWFDHVFKFPIL